MKILGTPSPLRTDKLRRAEQDRRDDPGPGRASSEGETVVLSETARFIRDLKETAAGMSMTRRAEIERARQDIQSGLLDTDAEIAAAADGFLAGL